MKMKNNILFSICILFTALLFMPGCSYFEYQTKAPARPPAYAYYKDSYMRASYASGRGINTAANNYNDSYTTYTYKAASFDRVEVKGYADVLLAKGKMSVTSNQVRYLPPAYIAVRNRVLIVDVPRQNVGQVFITIKAPVFTNITAINNVFIHSKNIVAKQLSIETSDSASVNLRGDINLRNIQQSGASRVDVSWINSKLVNVDAAGNGYIYLAGAAKTLLLKLKGSTILDARYLRAEEVNALTTDKAKAHIFATMKMNAYADVKSTIYYHNKIFKNMATYSNDEGNVLQTDVLP